MGLLDAYGRKIRSGKPVLEEIGGVSGIRDRYSTYPSHGLTPERLTSIFKEADQGEMLRLAELFEEMEEKDAHLGAVLQTRKLTVAGLEWEVVAASEDKEDEKVAEFVREALGWIGNWDDALMGMLDAVGKGFSVSEIMWEIDGGKVWCNDIRWRHTKKFTFYSKEKVLDVPRLLTDEQPFYGEELIPNKFIYHRAGGRTGSVPRGGVLRACAWMYLFKNYTLKDWVIFLERFAMPMRVGKYSPGASDDERKVLRNAVFNLGSDAAAVISESTIIEILEEKGKRGTSDLYEQLAAYCDRAVSKAVLGHTGSSDSTPGKLGSEHEARDVRQDILEADAKALAKTISMQLVYPLVLYNFGPDKNLPVFRFNYEEGEDLEASARTYKELSGMGLRIPANHVYQKFGIPMPEGDEEVITPQATGFGQPEAMKRTCPCGCQGGTRKVAMKDGGERDLVDSFTERLLEEAPVDGLVEQVEKLLLDASSLEEFRDRLLDIYKDMDVTALGTVMQKALVAAELSGRFRATDEG